MSYRLSHLPHCGSVARNLEDRIQQLCSQVAATHIVEELHRLCV